jgi:hypothetical protein
MLRTGWLGRENSKRNLCALALLHRALRKGQIVHDLLPLFAPHDSGRPNWARFLMRRFESCRPSQPVRSSPLFASGPSKSRGFAPFAGYYAVSASRIERRKCRSHHLSPRGIFRVSFLMEHSASVPVDPTKRWTLRESLWGMCTSQKYARGSTGSGYPGPGRGQVAASRRVRRFSKITMV